tara:strand:- start:163 stop:1047 length:885 start_codon:yes stop_codon:yes gene_type:complete
MAGPLAVIAANAIKYVVSGSARRALTRVVAELNKHYAKSKTKRSAEAIREKAKRMVQKGIAERSKVSKEIKQGGAFSQTSNVPLRLKGSGNVIPKTKTKIGSIPLKTAQQPKAGVVTKARKARGEYGRKPQQRLKGLGQRTTIGKNKYKQREIPVTGSTTTKGGASVSRVSKIATAAKRNKGKLLVGAAAIGVTAKALNKDTDKKKTTTTKKTTTKKNTKPFDNKNFPDSKKETKTKRKVDHSSNYRKSKKSKKTSSTKSNVSTTSRKKQKDNIVKTSYGGKVKTKYGFVRTGR